MLSRISLAALLACGIVASARSAVASEIPDDVKQAIAAIEQEVLAIQKKAADEIKAREKLAEAEIQARLEKGAAVLRALQESYTKAGKLDEALAIRERIKTLKIGVVEILAPPADLRIYRDQVGKVLHFEIVGSSSGSIYGTDIYSDDSSLATAAVHAGVLKDGEKGIVKVTILPGQPEFTATTRHGVSSFSWMSYPGAYKVESASRFARRVNDAK